MKKALLAITLALVMVFTGCSGAVQSLSSIELPKKETPIADNADDNYKSYGNSQEDIDSSTEVLKKELEDIGAEFDVYESEEEYKRAQQKAEREAAENAKAIDTAFEPVMQTITVLTTATGSEEHGNYVPSKPIKNAVVRLDGIPRFTDRNGQIIAALDKEYAELYVEKNDYVPYIEIMDVTGTEKIVCLKEPHDDIDIYAVMIDENGETANLLLQDYHLAFDEDFYFANLTICSNIVPDMHYLYCNGELVYSQESNFFEYFEFAEFFDIGDSMSVQVEYQGIKSKILPLRIQFRSPIIEEEVFNLTDDKINVNIDGVDQKTYKAKESIKPSDGSDLKKPSEPPTFFGAVDFDFGEIFEYLFKLDRLKPQLKLSVNPRTATVKLIIGVEIEFVNTDKKNKLSKELNKYKEELNDIPSPGNKEEQAARRAIKEKMAPIESALKELDKKDFEVFGKAYHDIRRGLERHKGEDNGNNTKRTAEQLIKDMKHIRKYDPTSGKPKPVITNAPYFKVDFEALGVVEFSLATKKFTEFSLLTGVTGSINFGGQFLIGWLPLFWRAEVGLGVDLNFKFISDNAFKLADFLTLTINIFGRGEFGVGMCDLASISGNLKLTFEFLINFFDNSQNEINFNIKAWLKLQVLFFKLEWDIVDHDVNLYGKNKALLSSRSNTVDSLSENQLFSDIYQSSKPQAVQVGDKTILTWVEDCKGRDDYNRTVLKYSICENGIWSDPKAVWDDGKADFYHNVYAVGDKVYITWQKNKTVFDQSVTLKEMSAAGEIYVAEYDAGETAFGNVRKITNNDHIDMYPRFAVGSGKNGNPLTIVWKSNSEDNLLGISGNNSIYYSKFNGTNWSGPKELISETTYISNPIAAYIDNELTVATIQDHDNDLMTADQTILLVKNSEKLNILGEGGSIMSLQFLETKGEVLLSYQKDSKTYITKDLVQQIPLISALEGNVDNVQLTADDSGNLLIYYTKTTDNEKKQIFASYYEPDKKKWSKEIRLTEEKADVYNPFALCAGNEMILFYNVTDENDNVVLASCSVALNYNVSISRMYLTDNFTPNKEINLNIELFNEGDLSINGAIVKVLGKEYTLTLDTPLNSGEYRFITVTIVAEEQLNQISVTVDALSGSEVVYSVQKDLFVGYTDLDLSVESRIYNGHQLFTATVENLSDYSTKACFKAVADGKILFECNLDLKLLEAQTFEFTIKEVSVGSKIDFIVETTMEDYDVTNNKTWLYSMIEEKQQITRVNNYDAVLTKAKELLI